jgi:hypothetical protein
LGTDSNATSTLTLLQDGLGNSIGVGVNTSGDLFLSGSLTASLQEGYAWVGNASGKSAAIPTSSFGGGGSIPAGTISSSAQITALGFVSSSVTASSLITASFDNGTRNLTFTKGDATTFNVNIPDTSGSTGNFATTGSNTFVGDQTISGSLFVSGSEVLTGTLSASALRVENNTYLDGTLTVTNNTLINGDVTIQSATPNLKLRDTSGGGFSSGYDLRVDTGSFEIYDDTHNRDVLSDFFDLASQQHTTSLTSEIIVISGSTSVTLIGNVSASIISASTINGLGDPLAFSQSVDSRLDNLESTSASLLIETQNLELFSASALTSLSNLNTATASLFTSASLALTTASVSGTIMTFTKGDASTFSVTLPTGSGGSIDTGSFATTGSNTFTGDQTLTDGAGNTITLNDTSGSLLLVGKGFTTSTTILSPVTNSVNLAFKSSTNAPTTILSGSNNIFTVSPAVAGFNRFLSSGNIGLILQPNISASMAFPVNINSNYFTAPITVRGPVSSSAYNINNNTINSGVNFGTAAATNFEKADAGLTFNTNYIGGQTNFVASKTDLSASVNLSNSIIAGAGTALGVNLNSSSVNANSNLIIGGAQINSDHTNNTATQATLAVTSNAFIGSGNVIQSNGIATAARQLFASMMVGVENRIRLEGDGSGGSVSSTILLGQSLSISGSSAGAGAGGVGTTIVGRFNSEESSQIDAGRVVFAVGTGGGVGTRRTTLLIDSGSNAIVSGSLLISGTAFLNGVALGGTIDTGSFATTGSNSFVGNQTITGNLTVNGGNIDLTGSTTFNGNVTMRDRSGNFGNIILGNLALGTGLGNTNSLAIGNASMQFASASSQNVAIGANTLTITSGSNNVAIGSAAMESNLTGNQNTAIGVNALNKNTTGGNNFALGSSAMFENTTGNQNVAIGVGALYSNTTGMKNVAIGNDAGIQASGSQNIFIGASAGQNITGSNNTIIGSFTGTAGSPLNDNIILADGAGNARAQYSGSAWSLQDGIKLNKGSNKTTDIVTVNGSLTVSNSLVTIDSIILVTTQDAENAPAPYPAVVSNKGTGTFGISHGYAGNLKVAYLIINPTT